MSAQPRFQDRELLRRRLRINLWVRIAVALLFVGGALLAAGLQSLTPGRVRLLGLFGLLVAAYGLALYLVARRHQDMAPPEGRADPLVFLAHTAIVLDYLVLAAAVAILGGARSPFTAFYLVHISLACLTLSRRAAIGFSALALLLISLQVGVEWWAGTPIPGVLSRSQPWGPLDGYTAAAIVSVYGALFIITDVLLLSLVEWLRVREAELAAQTRRLDRLSELRRDFLLMAVHNLRAPVGASLALLENLQSGLAGPVTEDQNRWMARIQIRLEGLLDLLHDMRILGALESEEVAAQARPTDLRELLDDVVEEYFDQAARDGVTLFQECGDPLPPVRGIPRLLREALVNYVTNALKYGRQGGLVRVRCRAVQTDGETWVRAEVHDDGPGVAPEDRERLFRDFTRGSTVREGQEQTPGSGMGLALVKRVVEAHGGRVGVEHPAGGGSLFYLELPGLPES